VARRTIRILLAGHAVAASALALPPATAALHTASLAQTPRGCTVRGTAADDALVGTAGDDVICGLGGDDKVRGARGHDLVYGDRGNDSLSGGTGNDRLGGGSGSDILSGGFGRDRLNGGAGRDRLFAVDGQPDRAACGTGRDVVHADRFDLVAVSCEIVRWRRAGYPERPALRR
jgi:hypothetical protein